MHGSGLADMAPTACSNPKDGLATMIPRFVPVVWNAGKGHLNMDQKVMSRSTAVKDVLARNQVPYAKTTTSASIRPVQRVVGRSTAASLRTHGSGSVPLALTACVNLMDGLVTMIPRSVLKV